jgi:hypothetical protein
MKTYIKLLLILSLTIAFLSCSEDEADQNGFDAWCIMKTSENGQQIGYMGNHCDDAIEIDELKEIDIELSVPYPNPVNTSFLLELVMSESDSLSYFYYSSPSMKILIPEEGFRFEKAGNYSFHFAIDSLKTLLGRRDSVVQIAFQCIKDGKTYESRRFLLLNREHD